MKKIYVVTSGDYSDYSINAVFSTKLKAEEYCEFFNEIREYCKCVIEEFDVDKTNVNDYRGKKCYSVRMDRDGNTKEMYENRDRFDDVGLIFFDQNGNLYTIVIADSQDGAVKIANERRVQLIATDRWGVNNEI